MKLSYTATGSIHHTDHSMTSELSQEKYQFFRNKCQQTHMVARRTSIRLLSRVSRRAMYVMLHIITDKWPSNCDDGDNGPNCRMAQCDTTCVELLVCMDDYT